MHSRNTPTDNPHTREHLIDETGKYKVRWWYLSAALKMPEAVWDRSSGGQVERKMRSSFIIERMFTADTRASDRSKARLKTKSRINDIYNCILHTLTYFCQFFFKCPGTVSQKCLDLSDSPQWFLCAAALHCGPSVLSSEVTSSIYNCYKYEMGQKKGVQPNVFNTKQTGHWNKYFTFLSIERFPKQKHWCRNTSCSFLYIFCFIIIIIKS